MMTTLTISLVIVLLCHDIYSDNTILTRQLIDDPSTNVNKCTDASQCPFSDACVLCKDGRGPDCEQPTCINGKCGVIKQCSQDVSSTTMTTSSNNQCKGTDASQCVFHRICALCTQGRSPSCTEAVCVKSQCKIIPACSIYTSTISSTSTKSSTTAYECENDNQCLHPEYCVSECKDGSGPLCASAKCINRKCQTVSPCSKTSQCTQKDLSQCVVSKICAACKQGYTPPCTQAVCENGQCKTIMPCTIFEESTTTVSPREFCIHDDQCPHSKVCATKCDDGTSPLCASAKCVDGKCINIKPCSQRICKTRATCPYNKHNCATCQKDYGPGCEQAACSCGVCSIVPPCSKKLNAAANTIQ